jgi:hypothetical protein
MSCIGVGGSYCSAGGADSPSFAFGIGAEGFPASEVERIIPLCSLRVLSVSLGIASL